MICQACGKEIDKNATVCAHCGAPVNLNPKKKASSSAAERMLLPIDRSGYAIAAGYLGLFSILAIFAPFALLFGILAVRDIRKNSDKHGMGRAVFGIIMGAIFSLLLVAGVFAYILQ